MKTRTLLLSSTLIIFSLLSFNSPSEKLTTKSSAVLASNDGNCGVDFVISGSNCTVAVVGSIDCNGIFTMNISSFTGTITFSGTGCPNGTITVGYAVPVVDEWTVPTGYAVAFYKIGNPADDCDITDIEFIGSSSYSGYLSTLNLVSAAFIAEIQKDSGC